MIVKLLTETHLEFLSLKGGCRGLSESTLVKMPHCWKSHALAQLYMLINMAARDLYPISHSSSDLIHFGFKCYSNALAL